MRIYGRYIKRLLDIILSSAGIIVCCIPMAIIAVAIKIDSKGPALFKQRRVGYHGKEFTIFKFRTMIEHAFEMGGVATHSDDPRITRVGAFLRRTSLDELPQMFNILKGEMSIIGPRPILKQEIECEENYSQYLIRHDVRPGMFCTVDVKYRSACTRQTQFEMDVAYVEQLSFLEDVKCFFQIIGVVLSGKNVYRVEVGEKTAVK